MSVTNLKQNKSNDLKWKMKNIFPTYLKRLVIWKMNYPNSLLYALLALLALQHTVHGLPKECKAPPRDPVQPDYCEEEEQPHVACNNSAVS